MERNEVVQVFFFRWSGRPGAIIDFFKYRFFHQRICNITIWFLVSFSPSIFIVSWKLVCSKKQGRSFFKPLSASFNFMGKIFGGNLLEWLLFPISIWFRKWKYTRGLHLYQAFLDWKGGSGSSQCYVPFCHASWHPHWHFNCIDFHEVVNRFQIRALMSQGLKKNLTFQSYTQWGSEEFHKWRQQTYELLLR